MTVIFSAMSHMLQKVSFQHPASLQWIRATLWGYLYLYEKGSCNIESEEWYWSPTRTAIVCSLGHPNRPCVYCTVWSWMICYSHVMSIYFQDDKKCSFSLMSCSWVNWHDLASVSKSRVWFSVRWIITYRWCWWLWCSFKWDDTVYEFR